MKIFIDDIPEEGLTVSADAKNAPWLKAVLKSTIRDGFTDKDTAHLALVFIRFDRNVDIAGDIKIGTSSVCDRCLKKYTNSMTFPIHIIMAPLYESKRQQKRENKVDIVLEDDGFSYYKKDEIDLDDVLREQVVLSQPIKYICSESCKGLCQKCGKDLNEGACGCVEDKHDPRWDVLKGFKPAGKKGGKKGKKR